MESKESEHTSDDSEDELEMQNLLLNEVKRHDEMNTSIEKRVPTPFQQVVSAFEPLLDSSRHHLPSETALIQGHVFMNQDRLDLATVTSCNIADVSLQLQKFPSFQQYLQLYSSTYTSRLIHTDEFIKRVVRDYLSWCHRRNRHVYNIWNILQSVSAMLHGLSPTLWDLETKKGNLLARKTTETWLENHKEQPLRSRKPFVATAIDNLQVSKHRSEQQTGFQESDYVHLITWLERSVRSPPSSRLRWSEVWVRVATTTALRKFVQQHRPKSTGVQRLKDLVAQLDHCDFRDINIKEYDEEYVCPPWVNFDSSKAADVHAVLNALMGMYEQQPFVPVYVDEALFSMIWNHAIVGEWKRPLLPAPALFHYEWAVVMLVHHAWPFLYEIAERCGSRSYSAENERDGFRLGDDVIRVVTEAALRVLKTRFPDSKDLEKRFNTLDDFEGSEANLNLLIHFLFLGGSPYVLLRRLVAQGDLHGNALFWNLWCHWLPYFRMYKKVQYSRLTATIVLMHLSLAPEVWETVLQNAVIHCNRGSHHYIPVDMQVEEVTTHDLSHSLSHTFPLLQTAKQGQQTCNTTKEHHGCHTSQMQLLECDDEV